MGGLVALTLRFNYPLSNGMTEYRGSCWTNVLPDGLFDAPFYDPATSEAHAWGWIEEILANRAEEPEADDLWGSWGKLAPIDYGIVVVDYVSKSAFSFQNYCSLTGMHRFDWDNGRKWRKLKRQGLLRKEKRIRLRRGKMYVAKINASKVFSTVECADQTDITRKLQDKLSSLFPLTADEQAAWDEWFAEQAEP